MKIRSHCKPGGWRNKEGWLPLQKWPENCTVQWGDRGVVLKKGGLEKAFRSDDPLKTTTEETNYVTAFFEVFLEDPNAFLRGEGPDREEAESNAWEKYVKIINCKGHEFERRGYTNGLGFCKHCDLAQKVFEPSTKCCICGTPTSWGKDDEGKIYCEDHISESKFWSKWMPFFQHTKGN